MGAFSSAFNEFAGAASELFASKASEAKSKMYQVESQADLLKGEGYKIEGENYGKAQELALKNEEYARESTAIQQAQADRTIYLQTGEARAAAGAAGVAESGSALDILADSARQGELQKQVLARQGLITEAGYEEQAQTYGNLQRAAGIAVQGAQLASQEHMMASEAEDTAAEGHKIVSGIKATAGTVSLIEGAIGAVAKLGSLGFGGD